MNKEKLNKLASESSPRGFRFSPENQGFIWYKKHPERTERITVGYKEYNDTFFLQRPSAYVAFHEVDNLLSGINIPSNFLNHDFTCRYLEQHLKINEQGDTEVAIKNDIEFQNWLDQNQKFIERIFSFFANNSTTMDVYKNFSNMVNKDAIEFLGQPFPLRKMCLLYLVSPNEYLEFSKRVVDHYENNNSPLLESTKELVKKLKNNYT